MDLSEFAPKVINETGPDNVLPTVVTMVEEGGFSWSLSGRKTHTGYHYQAQVTFMNNVGIGYAESPSLALARALAGCQKEIEAQ